MVVPVPPSVHSLWLYGSRLATLFSFIPHILDGLIHLSIRTYVSFLNLDMGPAGFVRQHLGAGAENRVVIRPYTAPTMISVRCKTIEKSILSRDFVRQMTHEIRGLIV